MDPSPIRGLIAAAITPFHEDASLALDRVPVLVERATRSGLQGFYVCGSTGEGVSLTIQERKDTAQAYVEACRHHGLISMIQVGHNALPEARELARHALEIGAGAISATCPNYFPVRSNEQLVACMVEIASAAPDLPFYYYHIPALTGNRLSMPQFLEAAKATIPNFAGLKFTTPELHHFQLCQAKDSALQVFWGTDEMLLPALACGANAAIGSTYNVLAGEYLKLWKAFEAGDLEQARRRQLALVHIVNTMLSVPFHAALRHVCALQGVEVGPCRLPNENLSDPQKQALEEQLASLGMQADGAFELQVLPAS